MATTHHATVDLEAVLAEVDAEQALRPDEPSLPLGEWMKKNLFSTPFNSVLTIVFALFGIFAYRGILDFIFSEERDWNAVRVNMRLLFTQAYPQSQFSRVWVAVGTVFVLAGLSMGLAKAARGVSFKKISTWFLSAGLLVVSGVVLREPSVLTNDDGSLQLDENNQVVRESFGAAMADRVGWWIIGLILLGVGLALWIGLGDLRRRTTFVPTLPLIIGALGFAISSVWWYRWGHYGFSAERGFFAEPGRTVAATTKGPLTVIWFAMLIAYFVARWIARSERRGTALIIVNTLWLLSPFLLFWVVLRDPDIDYDHVWSTDLPMALGFLIIGGLILWALTSPRIGEVGRIIATLLIALALFHWVAAFFGWYPMLQKARFSFLFLGLAALLAPNFIGDARQRLRLIYAWVAIIVFFHYLVTLINSPSTVVTPSEGFAGGFMITIFVAVFTMIFSFPLGVLLALGRTSKMPLFRVMSTTYIEVMRGVPLITMLFFFANFVNLFLPNGMSLAKLSAATIAFTLFSAAYLAENVRGGLQAIRQGQYEASDALGLSTVQRTIFIVLPQGLRVSIPPLVGQMIATYKETSLLFIIGLFDFLYMANKIIPAQTEFLGVKLEGLLFISVVYWLGSYSMSKYSQRLERQLGVGER